MRGEQGKGGALVSLGVSGDNLGNPVISNLESVQRKLPGIYRKPGIGQGCARTRSGIKKLRRDGKIYY